MARCSQSHRSIDTLRSTSALNIEQTHSLSSSPAPRLFMDKFLAPHTPEAAAHSHLRYVSQSTPAPLPCSLVPQVRIGLIGTWTTHPLTRRSLPAVRHTEHSIVTSVAQIYFSIPGQGLSSRASCAYAVTVPGSSSDTLTVRDIHTMRFTTRSQKVVLLCSLGVTAECVVIVFLFLRSLTWQTRSVI